ncbi:MAG TPA: STAS domain-containing protein [bacterium]|nr:STAS domain-containing protein [bacterium]
MMTLEKTLKGNKLIIKLGGRIGGESSISMYREIKSLLDDYKDENVVLEFSKLEFIDSSGLGSLVAVNSTLLKQGRSLTIVAPPENLMELLKITNLDKILRIVSNINDA